MLVTARVQNLCMAKFHNFSQHTNNTSSFLHSQFVNTSAYKIVVHMMDRKRFHMTFVFVVLTDFNNTRMFAIYINTIFSNIVCNIDKKVVKGITNLSFWFIEGASSVGITGTNCQCCCSCCVMICGRLVHLGIKYRRRLNVAPGSRVFIYPLFKSL